MSETSDFGPCMCFVSESSSCYKPENILQESKRPSHVTLLTHEVHSYCFNMLFICLWLPCNGRTINLLCIVKPSEGREIISHNCPAALTHFPVNRPLIKTNRAADIWTVYFAATAVRQLRVRGLAGLPAPLSRLRLGLRRLLPRPGPLLRLGRTQLLPLLSLWQKVHKGSQY